MGTSNRRPLTYQSKRTGCRWYCQGRASKPWPPVSNGEEEHLDMSIICYGTWPIISMFLVASVMIMYRVMHFLTHQSHQCCLRDVFTSIIPPVCYCKKLWVYPFSWPRFETMNEHSFIDDLIQFLKIYTKLYGTPCNKEIVNLKEHPWRSI